MVTSTARRSVADRCWLYAVPCGMSTFHAVEAKAPVEELGHSVVDVEGGEGGAFGDVMHRRTKRATSGRLTLGRIDFLVGRGRIGRRLLLLLALTFLVLLRLSLLLLRLLLLLLLRLGGSHFRLLRRRDEDTRSF